MDWNNLLIIISTVNLINQVEENLPLNRNQNRILVIILFFEVLCFILIVSFLHNVLDFYNLAEWIGISIIVFQFYLGTFHFNSKYDRLKKELGDDIEASIALTQYKKFFNIIVLSSLVFSFCLGIIGLIQDIIIP